MSRSTTLSIITVTKNRSQLLTLCLNSLIGQCKKGDEIIIIDASSDDTPNVVARLSTKLPLKYIRYLKPGYPAFYNKAAKAAKGDILVFYDDDCVAAPNFLTSIREGHRKHPGCILQGITYSIPRGNLYVDIMGDHYKNWLAAMIIKGNDMKSFDSKNASMPRALFWQYNGLSPAMYRGSEDIELGIRMRRGGVRILLDRSIVAYHHERTTLKSFLVQHQRFAQSEGYLDHILLPSERLGVIPQKKLLLHIRSFFRRELSLMSNGKLYDACILPIIYILLAIIRISGYARHR